MKRDTLNFHDSRIRQADVLAASSNSAWAGVGHLRLGFSGRLIKIKGPQFAIHVASEAHRRGLPVNLHIFGTGPLVRANGFGWTVPQRDVSGMVDVIENLLADPSRISFARERGLKFMQQHNFESTTQRRAEHLMQFVR